MASPCTSCLCVLNACSQQSSRPITVLQQDMQPSHRLSPIANSCHHHYHSHQLFTGALPPCLPLRLATKARKHGRVARDSSMSVQTSVRSKSHCRNKSRQSLDACHVSPNRKCYCAESQQDHTGWIQQRYNNGTVSCRAVFLYLK